MVGVARGGASNIARGAPPVYRVFQKGSGGTSLGVVPSLRMGHALQFLSLILALRCTQNTGQYVYQYHNKSQIVCPMKRVGHV